MKKVLRYLSRTQKLGIVLRRVSSFSITNYCVANWGGFQWPQKSNKIPNLYGWFSCSMDFLQIEHHRMIKHRIRVSSIATTITELEWVHNLLIKQRTDIALPLTLRFDNLGAMFIASNLVCHSKLKHVAIDLKYVREWVEAGSIVVSHITGKHQQANILMKALKPILFIDQRSNLVRELSQDWGGVSIYIGIVS